MKTARPSATRTQQTETKTAPLLRPVAWRQGLRSLIAWFFSLLVSLAVLGAVALGGAWWWIGSEGSLAQTLKWLAPGGPLARLASDRAVPLGQLDARDVSGSLRHGGRLGALRWQQQTQPGAGLVLEAQDLTLHWTLERLLEGQLQIDQLVAGRVNVALPVSSSPAAPPQSLSLPLPVSVEFKLGQLHITGGQSFVLEGLQGRYSYGAIAAQPGGIGGAAEAVKPGASGAAGAQHSLNVDAVTLAQGQYALTANLQADAPLALQARLNGRVRSQVPRGGAVTVQAEAQLTGQLAGPQPALVLTARIARASSAQTPPDRGATPLAPMRPKVPGRALDKGPTLEASARLLPWDAQPLHSLRLTLANLNLAEFWPQAPASLLSGRVLAEPSGTDWRASVSLTNELSGPWDRQRLPARGLDAEVLKQGTQWALSSFSALIGDGALKGQGSWQPPAGPKSAAPLQPASPWQGQLSFSQINPGDLYSPLANARLDGRLSARAEGPDTAFEFSLVPVKGGLAPSFKGLTLGEAQAQGVWRGDSLRLDALSLQAAEARLKASGEFHLTSRAFDGEADLSFPGGNMRFKGGGKLPVAGGLPALSSPPAPLTAQVPGWPDSGELRAALTQADQTWAWLNRLAVLTSLVPDVGASVRRWAVRGQAEATLGWTVSSGVAQARVSVPRLTLQAPPDASGAAPAPLTLSQLRLSAEGPVTALALQLDGTVEQSSYRARLDSRAVAALSSAQQGALDLSRLNLRLQDGARGLAWALDAVSPGPSEASAMRLRWNDGDIDVLPGQLRLSPQDLGNYRAPKDEAVTLAWDSLSWDAQGLRTRGRLLQLSLAWVDWLAGPSAQPLADLGLGGQLWFDGDWDLHWPRDARTPVRLNAGLQRQRGDFQLSVDDGTGALQQVAAGLSEVSLRLTTEAGPTAALSTAIDGLALRARLKWVSQRAGQVDAEATTRLQAVVAPPNGGASAAGWTWAADAPLQGTLSAQLPQIGVWSLLAPPGWRLRGTLAAQASLAGSRSAPKWQGQLQADQLALRSVVDGIEFVNGQLRGSLKDDRVLIERFSLEGAGGAKSGGQLEASGFAQWVLESPAAPAATAAPARRVPHINLKLTLDKLRVSNRADRRLVVSGESDAQLAGARLRLRGKLRADQAAITLPDETTPRLGDDVVVRGRRPAAETAPGTRVVPDVLLALDLGDNFAVQGSGLQARLQGALQLRSTPEQPVPQVAGEVRTTSGSYRAYGVRLNLETGLLRFAGPFDNPGLEILAVRPNTTQRVGVQVSGTARAPMLRLYADPDLPDSEKLSWLVLGRSAAGPGGDAAILQQAALSLLGRPGNTLDGGLAGALGLDEVSYRSGGVGADGSVTSAAVQLGKRLSSNLYVVYGRSLTGSVGTIAILYEVSRRLTLRAQTGDDSALELMFTTRYD